MVICSTHWLIDYVFRRANLHSTLVQCTMFTLKKIVKIFKMHSKIFKMKIEIKNYWWCDAVNSGIAIQFDHINR